MLRELDIPPDWVAESKLGPLPNWLGPSLTAEEARELQGTIFLMFPKLEVDGVSIFDVPGVIEWLRLVHGRIPHLVYFLEPSQGSGALEGLARALVPPELIRQDDPRIPFDEESMAKLTAHLVAAAEFAIATGDDWRPILSRFLEPLEEAHRNKILAGVRDAISD